MLGEVNDPVLQAQAGRTLPLAFSFQFLVMKSWKLSELSRSMSEYDVFPQLIFLDDL